MDVKLKLKPVWGAPVCETFSETYRERMWQETQAWGLRQYFLWVIQSLAWFENHVLCDFENLCMLCFSFVDTPEPILYCCQDTESLDEWMSNQPLSTYQKYSFQHYLDLCDNLPQWPTEWVQSKIFVRRYGTDLQVRYHRFFIDEDKAQQYMEFRYVQLVVTADDNICSDDLNYQELLCRGIHQRFWWGDTLTQLLEFLADGHLMLAYEHWPQMRKLLSSIRPYGVLVCVVERRQDTFQCRLKMYDSVCFCDSE